MSKSFSELRERLLKAGVAPRHVRRYVAELSDHLADLKEEEERAGLSPMDAKSAALIRLGEMDDLADALIEQRRFQSWSIRAPWAAFGLAPILILAAAWYVALFLLWSGWSVFLPETSTPFVRIQGLAMFYFGVGRSIFFGAPVLVGWGVGLMAVRQRFQAVWPAVSLVLIALIGGMGQVNVSHELVAGGLGHVSLDFSSGPQVHGGVVHALAILLLTALPYFIWQFLQARMPALNAV